MFFFFCSEQLIFPFHPVQITFSPLLSFVYTHFSPVMQLKKKINQKSSHSWSSIWLAQIRSVLWCSRAYGKSQELGTVCGTLTFHVCCFSYQAAESLICSNTQFISLSIQLLSDMKTPENTLSLDCLRLTVKSFLEAHFSNALDLMFYCQHLIVKSSCLKILPEFTNILDILVILLLSVSNLRVKYWFIFFFHSFHITFRIISRDSHI